VINTLVLLAQTDATPGTGWARPGLFLGNFWPVLVATAAGLAAVYLLLPRARRYPPLWGGVLGGLAVVAAGFWLIHFEVFSPEAVLFYAFAFIAVVAAGLMITQSNPVHAALAFALVVLSTCGLFLLLAAPFLMAATIIIYAGAIIVTFLFVIMLAQQVGASNADQRSREPFLAALAGFVLLAAILCVLQRTYDVPANEAYAGQLQALLEKTKRAQEATDAAGIRAIIGNGKEFFQQFLDLLQKSDFLPGQGLDSKIKVETTLNLAQESWTRRDAKVEEVRQYLASAYREGRLLQVRLTSPGTLPPDPALPVSPFSTGPAREAMRDAQGRARLPADNVASLGRTLFTDYLLAVEVAGFLLLVATIGAIAIAARRTEELR
jgi:NADH-quinone oxidoreductase subunit J